MSGETWDLVRHGEVAAIDAAACRVKVTFEELEITSDWLPVIQQGASGDKGYWMPAIGEAVVCAFYSDSTEEGVCLGSFYRAGGPPPAAGERFVVFPDGSKVAWQDGALTVEAKSGLTVVANTEHYAKANARGPIS